MGYFKKYVLQCPNYFWLYYDFKLLNKYVVTT